MAGETELMAVAAALPEVGKGMGMRRATAARMWRKEGRVWVEDLEGRPWWWKAAGEGSRASGKAWRLEL